RAGPAWRGVGSVRAVPPPGNLMGVSAGSGAGPPSRVMVAPPARLRPGSGRRVKLGRWHRSAREEPGLDEVLGKPVHSGLDDRLERPDRRSQLDLARPHPCSTQCASMLSPEIGSSENFPTSVKSRKSP